MPHGKHLERKLKNKGHPMPEEKDQTQMNYRLYYKLKKGGVSDKAAEEAAVGWAEYESRTPWGKTKAFFRERVLWVVITAITSLSLTIAAKFDDILTWIFK